MADKFRLAIANVIFLLRPEADGPVMRRPAHYTPPVEGCDHLLKFRVVRVWELTVEQLMNAGVEMLPLAPLTDVAEQALPDLVERMGDRIRAEATARLANELWTATYVLMRLKYRNEMISGH